MTELTFTRHLYDMVLASLVASALVEGSVSFQFIPTSGTFSFTVYREDEHLLQQAVKESQLLQRLMEDMEAEA